MKNLTKTLLISLLILAFGCKTSKNQDATSIENAKLDSIATCPQDGECHFKVIVNASMEILKDDFGMSYPQLNEGNKLILEFEYAKDEIPNTADSSYRELIYLEIEKDNLEIELRDSELDSVKILFGRLCYCKGETGYYQITNGHLTIKKTKNQNEYQLNLSFETTEVPQVITHINETFSVD